MLKTRRTSGSRTPSRHLGFTLVELIIVIVVLGILSGIAIAGYTAVIRRSNESRVVRAAESLGRELATLGAQKASAASQTGSEADKTSRDRNLIWEAVNAKDLPSGYSIAIEGSAGSPVLLQRADAAAVSTQLTDIHATPRYISLARSGASACLQLSHNASQGGEDGWEVTGRRDGMGACDDTTIGSVYSAPFPQSAGSLAWAALLSGTGAGTGDGTKNLDQPGVAAGPGSPSPGTTTPGGALSFSYATSDLTADGAPQSFSPTISGGTGSYSYALSGSLPSGVSFDPNTGVFSTTGLTGSSDGTLDTGFANGLTGANNVVYATAVQPDGKIIIAGNFTTYNGVTRNRIARLNANGTLDASFDPGVGANNAVLTLALQSDGKIVIGGFFSSYAGSSRVRIARVNADGSLDASFAPTSGANNDIRTVVLQPDGKVLAVGYFTTMNGNSRKGVARLNSDGSIDASFNPGTGAVHSNGGTYVDGLALQSDGKIVVGGSFVTFNGTARKNIARLNSDGSVDTSFDPGTGTNDNVESVGVQPDGKIVLGGDFTSFNGTTRNRIARLNTNGSLDTGFDNGGTLGGRPFIILFQSDGKILLGGNFANMFGGDRNYVTRLNTDGTTDSTFGAGLAGPDGDVRTVALQSDGKVIIGGWFTNVNSTSRNRITRLDAALPAATTVTVTVTSGAATASQTITVTPVAAP